MAGSTRHKKIVLIIRNAYSYDFGGGERFPVYLAEELRKYSLEPIVITRSPKLYELASSRGLHVIRGWWWKHQNFSGTKIILFPIYLLWQLILFGWYLTLILRYRPVALHPQSRDDFIAATFAGRLLGKRIIWTDHADLKYIWRNHKVWYKNPVGKLVYGASKLAHHITLVSKSEKQLIKHHVGSSLPKTITVIHNGVNEYSPKKVKRSGADQEAVIFVATSRLVTNKGIGELISAFSQLSDETNARLWLLGDGPEEERFRNEAIRDKRIIFFGYTNEALDFVAAADVFVHPSYHEGFSLSLIEAAMLGKPIVACRVGGNPEIIIDGVNGLLVEPRSVKELHDAMMKLANNALLRTKFGEAARKSFEEDYVFSTIVRERFLPLYEK